MSECEVGFRAREDGEESIQQLQRPPRVHESERVSE